MDYGSNTVRELVHALGGPRQLSYLIQVRLQIAGKIGPTETAISKWNERNRVPFIYRKQLSKIAADVGHTLTKPQVAALDTGD